MSPAKKKTFESLEDAFLKALDLNDKSGEGLNEASSEQGEQSIKSSIENSLQALKAWQGKELLLGPDNMSVTIELSGGEPIAVAQMQAALEKAKIIHGIIPAALKRVEIISRSPEKMGKILIVEGTPPETRRQVRLHVFSEGGGTVPFEKAAEFLRCAALRNLFNTAEPSSILSSNLKVKAVNAGELLLEVKDNADAKPGRDVFGHEIECTEDPFPDAGDNVRFNLKTGDYEATAYGYIFIDGKTLSVLPPLWITADRNTANYIYLRQIPPFRYPTTIDVREMLLNAEINERCIHDTAIDKMISQMAAGLNLPRMIKLAETLQPQHGRNAVFSLSFDAGKKAGTLREDGSLDLRERNAVVSIEAGTLIAEKTTMTKGVDGCTLFGKTLKATPGFDKKIAIAQGVRIEEKKDIIRYFSDKNGNIKFARNTLSIQDIYEISGDVDYHTGNINVKTDLLIKGSVISGFTVKSGGDIAIMGAIENGATVIGQGNLTVNKGIIGEETRVVCHGSLRANHIQNAEVIVKGDVIVRSYLFNCMLIACGSITVLREQGPKSGRAAGGVVCSATGIKLITIGSPGNPGTVVAVRTDPEISSSLKNMEEQLLDCTKSITKISRSLPFDSFDPGQIKAALARIPETKRDAVIILLTNLNKLIKLRKTQAEAVEQLRNRIKTSLESGFIDVAQKIYQGSEIHIGEQKFILTEDIGPSLFKLQDGRIIRA